MRVCPVSFMSPRLPPARGAGDEAVDGGAVGGPSDPEGVDSSAAKHLRVEIGFFRHIQSEIIVFLQKNPIVICTNYYQGISISKN